MPNIYLRMPMSRCQYFRHRDERNPIAVCDPVVFGKFTPEYFVLRNGISASAEYCEHPNSACFSEKQWINMIHGRHPLGKKQVIKRNPNDYLTYAEVQQLCGHRDYEKSDHEDYLCIRLPDEVELIDHIGVVTSSWNLTVQGIRALLVLLSNNYKRSIVEWALATFDYCTSNGRVIIRTQAAMIERYLMRYNITPTPEEKDNLRRVIDRWLNHEHCNFRAYSCADMQYDDPKENVVRIDGVV